MRLRRTAGVTLIEILIAVSLLSLLSVGILVAMRIALNTMDKTDAHLVRNRRVSNSEKILENELAGLIPTRASLKTAPDRIEAFPFMQFEPQTMRFVTAYSLQDAWRGRAQIASFQVIPGDRGVGVRLIVNETPYSGPEQAGLMVTGFEMRPETGARLARFQPVLAGPNSFILADRLAYCRFIYQDRIFEPPFRIWRSDWADPSRLPLGIRIEMAPLEAAASEVHVMSVTVPIKITRDPYTEYADSY